VGFKKKVISPGSVVLATFETDWFATSESLFGKFLYTLLFPLRTV
jgi:hypothetical protein